MKFKLIIGLFCCLASIQIITPLSMIVRREGVLKNGERFKFKIMPVDPYDAFRGRYVALRVEADYIQSPKDLKLSQGQTVYAFINVDEQGFAKFNTVTTNRPQGKPYIQAKVGYAYEDKLRLELPFDRYYMEESAAPEAEKIYRNHTGGNKQDAYIIVRVKDGFAVIEQLYVSGQRIEDAVKQK